MNGHKRSRKKKPEFSKQILTTAKWECWIITAFGLFFTAKGYDTSFFAYVIPVSWGGYAIARAFYYNKAKSENAIKLRTAYRKAGLDPEPVDRQFESALDEEIRSDY